MNTAIGLVAALHVRLLAMRDDLRQRLAATETVEPAWLATLANVETVLAAPDLERDEPQAAPNAGDRRLRSACRRTTNQKNFGPGRPRLAPRLRLAVDREAIDAIRSRRHKRPRRADRRSQSAAYTKPGFRPR